MTASADLPDSQQPARHDAGAPYDVTVLRDQRVPTSDPDVTLSADVHLPVGAGPVPAVVTVWPYRKDFGTIEAALRWFARHGYASVLVDARGTGSSDGAPRPPFDPAEADDGVSVVGWAAAQSWCDGAVGMWGHSYGAIMALRTAARRPAALRAIVPFQCIVDPASDLWHPGGVRGGFSMLSWGAITLAQQLLPPLARAHQPAEQRRWRQRLQAEPNLVDLFRHAPDDPVWRDRTVDVSTVTVPALCVAGWADLMCEGTISAFEAVSGPKRLVVGPWAHTVPNDAPVEPVDLLALTLRWWDRWLRGIDDGVMEEPQVSIYVQGADPGWRGYPSWPPAKAELALTSTAHVRLVEHAGQDDPAVLGATGTAAIAVYEPDPTAGALSTPWWLGHPGIPQDQHDDDRRGVQLDSDPADGDLLILGRPEVTVVLSQPPAAATRVVVRLADVAPDGRSSFISAGLAPLPAGARTVQIRLWPTAHRVRAGHRLRVVVGDADFPRTWPAPDPVPLHIARVALVAPVPDEEAGSDVDMPRPGPPAPDPGAMVPVRGDRRWRISREVHRDEVEVLVAEDVAAHTPGLEHLVELKQEVRARVRRSAPQAAVMEARTTTAARLGTGEHVEATVRARLTGTGLWLRGEVRIDGTTTFERTWDVPTPHEPEAPRP